MVTAGATTDREAILRFAGFHRLSPALDDGGRPAFSSGTGDGLTRCGWEPFFAAMRARGVALECDPDDASSFRFVAAGAAARHGGRPPALSRALDDARRFWKALFP